MDGSLTERCARCQQPITGETDDPLGVYCGECFDRLAEAHWITEDAKLRLDPQ